MTTRSARRAEPARAARHVRFAIQCMNFGDRDVLTSTRRAPESPGHDAIYTADHLGNAE